MEEGSLEDKLEMKLNKEGKELSVIKFILDQILV